MAPVAHRPRPEGHGVLSISARLGMLAVTLASALALVLWSAPAASAHVVPTSTIQLDVHETNVLATVSIPLSDLESASGIDLGGGTSEATTAATLTDKATEVTAYLLAHFRPTTDIGQPWSVTAATSSVNQTGDPTTTGLYQQVVTTFTLTPPVTGDIRSFDLGYDAVVDKVATHVVVVAVRSDWSSGHVGGAYELGIVARDTVTNTITPLHVDLGPGSEARGFMSMLTLGMRHIQEGTDHQLFLLTLLLPAPLLAVRRRWSGPVPVRRALHRITTITVAFTLGHSVTLALGALGFPVAQSLVEAAIAVSILVAAIHAIRPVFPGREAAVAAGFGLVHGLAFSETLRELDLTGPRLVLSLLGFNLGIEAMQLVVVALVLPPLIVLARAGRYQRLHVIAAIATAVAANGWLAARLGLANPVADLADQLGRLAVPVVLALWLCVIGQVFTARRARPLAEAEPGTNGLHTDTPLVPGMTHT